MMDMSLQETSQIVALGACRDIQMHQGGAQSHRLCNKSR